MIGCEWSRNRSDSTTRASVCVKRMNQLVRPHRIDP